jgi:hypothetical protein
MCKGFLIEKQGMTYLADTDPDLAFGPLQAAACTYRIALGLRAGQKVLSVQTVLACSATPSCAITQLICVSLNNNEFVPLVNEIRQPV